MWFGVAYVVLLCASTVCKSLRFKSWRHSLRTTCDSDEGHGRARAQITSPDARDRRDERDRAPALNALPLRQRRTTTLLITLTPHHSIEWYNKIFANSRKTHYFSHKHRQNVFVDFPPHFHDHFRPMHILGFFAVFSQFQVFPSLKLFQNLNKLCFRSFKSKNLPIHRKIGCARCPPSRACGAAPVTLRNVHKVFSKVSGSLTVSTTCVCDQNNNKLEPGTRKSTNLPRRSRALLARSATEKVTLSHFVFRKIIFRCISIEFTFAVSFRGPPERNFAIRK